MRAFTLIEILIVMAIISVASPIAYSNVSSYYAQARDYRRKADLKKIELAMEEYYDFSASYPPTIPECNHSFSYGNTILMEDYPCDPKTQSPYTYLTDDLVGYQWYKVYTKLEKSADQSIALVGCENGCGPECHYNFGVASSNISITTCFWPMAQQPTPIPTIPNMPSPTVMPTDITEPTPTPIVKQYVCAPGGGQSGSCEVFDDPDRSLCPVIYPNDPTCQNQCWRGDKQCKNASGKYKPL
jgi:general secretion pathway protein G